MIKSIDFLFCLILYANIICQFNECNLQIRIKNWINISYNQKDLKTETQMFKSGFIYFIILIYVAIAMI